MNKALPIQRSKTVTSYGGVGSNIETIDNLALLIEPFDRWNLYQMVNQENRKVKHLLYDEQRLSARLRALGFNKLEKFFLLEDFANETPVKSYDPDPGDIRRMITSRFFPRWFYCPKCKRFNDFNNWKEQWNEDTNLDNNWESHLPACKYCGGKAKGKGYNRPPLQQIRFVMASMETGEIKDIPWSKLFSKSNNSDEDGAAVWYISANTPSTTKEIKFLMSKGSADLYGISVATSDRNITMGELMKKYIVEIDQEGNKTVYRPVIRSANNAYFSYNISSLYIPVRQVPEQIRNNIKYLVETAKITDLEIIREIIRNNTDFDITKEEIRDLIDLGFNSKELVYSDENSFRKDEFDFITNKKNYKDNVFIDENDRLISEIYDWKDKPSFISNIFFQRKINVTTVQVAYSRIDKISLTSLPFWHGISNPPKEWFNPESKKVTKDMEVKLHPTCESDIKTIKYMPAVVSTGEGFFIELNLQEIQKERRLIFMHTLCHLIMKELEFSCGYSLASLSERLYYLPDSENSQYPTATDKVNNQPDSEKEKKDKDRFGFFIYTANGESGSFGGISSLFSSGKIKNIIENAILLANDCPNDPICEQDKGHCFACIDLPETSCELFNQELNRNVINSVLSDYNSMSESYERSVMNTEKDSVENEEDPIYLD